MNMESVGLEFLSHCRLERHLSANTLCAYAQDIAEFSRLFGGKKVVDIMGADLVRYTAHLTNVRKLAPATVKRRLACLRSLFAWLVRRLMLVASPFSTVELRVRLPDRLPRCLGRDDAKRLVGEAMNQQGRAGLATLLMLATGVRVGELVRMRRMDVDVTGGTIRVLGKGSKERQVYVPEGRLREALIEHLRHGDPGTSGDERLLGRQVDESGVRLALRKLAAAAALTVHVTPHMLRHTAATALLEAGVDMRFVQRLLGHRSISTTEIYTHVSDVALRAAVTAADVLARMRPTDADNPGLWSRSNAPGPSLRS